MRESSTPQSSVVSSFLMVEKSNENKSFAEGPGSKHGQVPRKSEEPTLRRVGMQARVDGDSRAPKPSHEDLSSHYCVDWLKAHVAYFSLERT